MVLHGAFSFLNGCAFRDAEASRFALFVRLHCQSDLLLTLVADQEAPLERNLATASRVRARSRSVPEVANNRPSVSARGIKMPDPFPRSLQNPVRRHHRGPCEG